MVQSKRWSDGCPAELQALFTLLVLQGGHTATGLARWNHFDDVVRLLENDWRVVAAARLAEIRSAGMQ